MGLRAELLARLSARQSGANDFGGPDFEPVIEAKIQLEDGTGAGEADILWVDERSIASASNDDIDLAGVLSSAFGTTITAAELVGLIIVNEPKSDAEARNTTTLTVGVGSNPVTPGFMGGTTPTFGPIQPGGFLFFGCGGASGFGPVTGGAADILRVANSSGAAAKYQIGAVLRSA